MAMEEKGEKESGGGKGRGNIEPCFYFNPRNRGFLWTQEGGFHRILWVYDSLGIDPFRNLLLLSVWIYTYSYTARTNSNLLIFPTIHLNDAFQWFQDIPSFFPSFFSLDIFWHFPSTSNRRIKFKLSKRIFILKICLINDDQNYLLKREARTASCNAV